MSNSRNLRHPVLLACGLLIAVAVLAYAAVVRPMLLRSTQITNLQTMRRFKGEVESFQRAHGAYPKSFSGLDAWGNAVSYTSDGRQYLLVSYGRDGRPDGSDYRAMRATGELRNEPCADLNANIVFSDRGELRNCGK